MRTDEFLPARKPASGSQISSERIALDTDEIVLDPEETWHCTQGAARGCMLPGPWLSAPWRRSALLAPDEKGNNSRRFAV
ncbi:hypothetical protein CMQ_116 [Grosmannia clavigera kw1407]|uniref:Uncharacterized protein n=1 Tax=Grosmannia clavigera (strain kw1407 / UAMH 11150) TaxID=655863 RepID=F0XRB9_GROCL|nr:uncharacterized protein CMQ_116 [Grosmannia clavigera kw1407]EFW99798.1 hypothetical protein CMQ_116 [Grosmannia clavigera kw1407]